MPAFRPESTRFWEKVDKSGDCWTWTAGCFGRNREYGCFYLTGGRKAIGAHVWAWVEQNGPVPSGRVIDHLCRNTKCVRPDHLEAVTQQTNILRGTGLAAVEAAQVVCLRGHSLEDAYILSRGRRDCRQCRKMRNASRTKGYRRKHG